GGDVSAELRGGLAPGPAAMAVELRREAVSLLDCRAVCDIRTELERIRAAEMRRRKMAARLSAASRTLPPPDPAILERTRLLEDLLARVEQVAADIVRIEQRILVDLYQERSNGPGGNTGELIAKQEQLDRLYLELFHRSLPEPDRITVALYSPTPRSSYELAGAYLAIARDRGCRVRVWRIVRGPVAGVDSGRLVRLEARDSDAAARGAATTGAPLEAIRLDSPEEFLAAAPVEDFGIALELEGYLAYPLLAAEAGRHRFIDAQGTADSIADTSAGAMADHHPPARIHMRATMNAQPLRRVYDAKQQKIEDRALGKSQYWKGKQVARVVGPWLEEQLRTMAKDWVHAC
ncbi:MAG: hypothetical protein HUU20_00810, partial [Pirellulales bacterium]|nr:hypothetical protein [Pirellulales bacterium]